jgi:DNA-binding MurR/RpiR family transcriptional regulator
MAEAASTWAAIVSLPGCPSALRREAREALAVHHEHRSRDLQTAKMLVMDTLAENPAPRWRSKAEYRLQRLESKLAKRLVPTLMDYC